MKYRIGDRMRLVSDLEWLARSIPSRPPVPILAGVRISAGADGLTLSVYDYENAARVRVETGDIQAQGDAVVPGHLLAKLIRTAKSIETVGNQLVLAGPHSTSRLPLLTLADYPDLPKHPEPSAIVPAADLIGAVEAIASVAGDDFRAWCNAVDLHCADGQLRIRGGSPYAVAQSVVDTSDRGAWTALPALRPLRAALKGLLGGIELGAQGSLLSVTSGNRAAVLTSMAVDFPPIDKLLAPGPETITFEAADMLAALSTMTTLTDRVAIVAKDDELTLTSLAPSKSEPVGESVEVIAGTTTVPHELHISIAYLTASLLATTGRQGMATLTFNQRDVRCILADRRSVAAVMGLRIHHRKAA